jgi:hypothetical protein
MFQTGSAKAYLSELAGLPNSAKERFTRLGIEIAGTIHRLQLPTSQKDRASRYLLPGDPLSEAW